MRRLLMVLFTCMLALLPFMMAAGSDDGGEVDEFPEWAYAHVITLEGTLNMRSRPKSNSSVVAKLPNESFVKVLEYGEKWSKVSYGSKTGYVMSSYLEEAPPPTPAPTPVPTPTPIPDEYYAVGPFAFATVETGKGTLNVRNQKREDSRIVAKLPNNSVVHVLERGREWAKVAYGAKVGYVMTHYLTLIEVLPYRSLQPDDESGEVRALKERMRELGYLTRRQVNDKYDDDLVKAFRKLELLNGMPETGIATAELQAFVFHGNVSGNKKGYGATNTDEASGLTVSIFAWTSGYGLLGGDDEGKVEVYIHYAANAFGGTEPYEVAVRWGNATSGETAKNPIRLNWDRNTPDVYLTATATDGAGNNVSVSVKVGIMNILPDPDAID